MMGRGGCGMVDVRIGVLVYILFMQLLGWEG